MQNNTLQKGGKEAKTITQMIEIEHSLEASFYCADKSNHRGGSQDGGGIGWETTFSPTNSSKDHLSAE